MILRLIIIGLTLSATAFADSRPKKGSCEANLTGLNLSYEQSLKYLLKLQREIDGADVGYPANQYVRLGIGRAVGPLVAALSGAGDGADSLPVDLSLKAGTAWTESMTANLYKILDVYLPAQALQTKGLVLLVYDEKTEHILTAVKLITLYLSEKKMLNGPVRVEFLTSQAGADARALELARALPPRTYTVRPIALYNDVRHWFHEALFPGPYDFSQYKLIDLGKTESFTSTGRSSERHSYQELKKDLAFPRSRTQN